VWYQGMLVELYPHISHLAGVVALLDETAEYAPDYVTYAQVKARSGLSDREQRNAHAALTRTSVSVFGHKTWPLAWQESAASEMRYWMPERIAEWWRAIRAGK
jgi:hypothetical protein